MLTLFVIEYFYAYYKLKITPELIMGTLNLKRHSRCGRAFPAVL